MEERKIDLESIEEQYKFLLVDSSFLSPLRHKDKSHLRGDALQRANSFARSDDEVRFISILEKIMSEKGNFYLSPLIFKELKEAVNHHFPYKKVIRSFTHPSKKDNRRIARSFNDFNKLRRRVVNLFNDNGKIIYFDKVGIENYDAYSSKYYSLKEKKGLSDSDFDFFISGLVLAKSNGPTALLSNDFGIVSVWGSVLRSEFLDSSKLGFFFRETYEDFRKAYENESTRYRKVELSAA